MRLKMDQDFTLAKSRHFTKIQNASLLVEEEQNKDVFHYSYLLDRHGFFIEREYNQYATNISDLLGKSKIMIIAESGMGKTYVMDYLAKQFGKESLLDIDAVNYLKHISSLDSVFDSNKEKEIVIIDGIDENPDIISFLRQRREMLEKKKLFMASRNIGNLHNLCQELELEIYLLLPLSISAIKAYAKKGGVNESQFVDTIIKKGLSPICAKPFGLKYLVEAYSDNTLDNTPNDNLWEKYIQRLCAEDGSKDQPDNNAISLEKCIEMISKMAIELKLSGCQILENIHQEMTEDNNFLHLSALYDNQEKQQIDNILSRGIFTPTAKNCFKFAHSSFLDYFAARGMKQYVNENKWKSIIINRDRNAIYPQWEGVAAWLPRYDEQWCDILLNSCPELLLASEQNMSKVNSETLCERLLERTQSMDYDRRHSFHLRDNLHRINQPEVIPVLKKALSKRCPSSKRELAIDIIREAKINKLENDLVKVFCDSKDEEPIRKDAGLALEIIGTTKARKKCKQILNDVNTSPVLKGQLFSMTWPQCITLEEINPHLIKGERNIFDAYERWVQVDFLQSLKQLTKGQAKEALSWAITDIQKDYNHNDNVLKMKKAVMALCWNKYCEGDFLELLSSGYYAFVEKYEYPFYDESYSYLPEEIQCNHNQFKEAQTKRRSLACVLIKNPSVSGYSLSRGLFSVLLENDFNFVMSELEKEKKKDIQIKWVECLTGMTGAVSSETKDQWNSLHKKYPAIIKEDAQTIIQEREMIESKRMSETKKNEVKKGDASERDVSLFRYLLNENPNANCLHNVYYACMRGKVSYAFAESQFWKKLSDTERNAVTSMAKRFLVSSKAPRRKPNTCYPLIPFACIVLYTNNKDLFSEIALDVWAKFSIDLLDFMEYQDYQLMTPVLRCIKKQSKRVFYQKIMSYVRSRLKQKHYIYLKKYENIVDEHLLQLLLREYCKPIYEDYFRFQLFKSIYDVNTSILEKIFKKTSSLSDCINKYGVYSSIFYFAFCSQGICELLRVLQTDLTFGKHLFEELMIIELRYNLVFSVFSEFKVEYLTDLYIWLHLNYPASEQPVHIGGFSPDSIDELYLFASKIFSCIYKSKDPLPSLHQIRERFPNDFYIDDLIKAAKYSELSQISPAYSLEQIKQIVDIKNNRRLVNSIKDLFDLTLDYLSKYQSFLTGVDTPRIEDLWNAIKINKKVTMLTHKEEEDFSDHLKSYLKFYFEEYKIAINREVQLNRGLKGKEGARTDIWLDAFSSDSSRHWKLCIEVKGSWNKTAKTALKEQLIDKYMHNGGADAGILLVGWFQSKSFKIKKVWKNEQSAKEQLKTQVSEAQIQDPLVEARVINCEYRL